MTEQIRAGAQTSNPSDSTTILTNAPAGKGSMIHAVPNGHSGACISDDNEVAPSDPVLLPLSSVQADLDMNRKDKYKKEKRLIYLFCFLAWSSVVALGHGLKKDILMLNIIVLVYWLLNVALCMAMWIVYMRRFRSDNSFKEYLNKFLFV